MNKQPTGGTDVPRLTFRIAGVHRRHTCQTILFYCHIFVHFVIAKKCKAFPQNNTKLGNFYSSKMLTVGRLREYLGVLTCLVLSVPASRSFPGGCFLPSLGVNEK